MIKWYVVVKKHHGSRDLVKSTRDDSYARDFSRVEEVLHSHPQSWHQYKDVHGGHFSVIEMEYNEMMNKRTTGTHAELVRELEELAAAVLKAHHDMTCP